MVQATAWRVETGENDSDVFKLLYSAIIGALVNPLFDKQRDAPSACIPGPEPSRPHGPNRGVACLQYIKYVDMSVQALSVGAVAVRSRILTALCLYLDMRSAPVLLVTSRAKHRSALPTSLYMIG